MFACISNGKIISRSEVAPKGVRLLKGKWLPEVEEGTTFNPITESLLGPAVIIEDNKVVYRYSTTSKNLEDSKKKAKKLVGEVCHNIRESGFVSSITGAWTGVLSKDNILRAEPVAKSARTAVAEGRGENTRSFKLATTGDFLQLTNAAIVAIDDEINGDTGFIQKCYDREAEICALIDIVDTTAEDVNTLYQTEIGNGWPAHGAS